MNQILIDIDGVVRDLYIQISKTLKKTKFAYEEGMIIFDIIKHNPLFLLDAPPTKYKQIIKTLIKKPVFVSYQQPSWRKNTNLWLEKHFNNFTVKFTNSAEEKIKYYKKANWIIEDYPHYKDYSKIILIDTVYNQMVKKPFVRIKTKDQLEKILHKIKGEKCHIF